MKRRSFLTVIAGLFAAPSVPAVAITAPSKFPKGLLPAEPAPEYCDWKRGITFVNPPMIVDTSPIDSEELFDLSAGRVIYLPSGAAVASARYIGKIHG